MSNRTNIDLGTFYCPAERERARAIDMKCCMRFPCCCCIPFPRWPELFEKLFRNLLTFIIRGPACVVGGRTETEPEIALFVSDKRGDQRLLNGDDPLLFLGAAAQERRTRMKEFH